MTPKSARDIVEQESGDRAADSSDIRHGLAPAEFVAADPHEQVPDDIAQEHVTEQLQPSAQAEPDCLGKKSRQKDQKAELRCSIDHPHHATDRRLWLFPGDS